MDDINYANKYPVHTLTCPQRLESEAASLSWVLVAKCGSILASCRIYSGHGMIIYYYYEVHN